MAGAREPLSLCQLDLLGETASPGAPTHFCGGGFGLGGAKVVSGSMIGTEAMGHTGKSRAHRAGNDVVSLARGPRTSGQGLAHRELAPAGAKQDSAGQSCAGRHLSSLGPFLRRRLGQAWS